MSDLPQQLRDFSPEFLETCPEVLEAADEIERLTNRLNLAMNMLGEYVDNAEMISRIKALC